MYLNLFKISKYKQCLRPHRREEEEIDLFIKTILTRLI